MKKNVFLTFCFACIPGTGAMYLGYMKRGLSQLVLFCGVVTLVAMFYLEPLMFMLPVIFAYCFFDTWNLRNRTPEQAAANPDAYIINLEQLGGENIKALMEKRHTLIGWGCIVVAGLLLYNNIFMRFVWRFDEYVPGVILFMINSIPSLGVVVALVLLGLYLLRGPRPFQPTSVASTQDEYVAYTGAQAPPVYTQTVPVPGQPELVLAATEPAAVPTEQTPALELEAAAEEGGQDTAKAEEALL